MDAFADALQKHRARDYLEAERLYRQLLIQDPPHVDANHGLGVLLNQTNRGSEAIVHLRRAVAARPDTAAIRIDLANVLLELGQLADAAAEYQVALRVAPDNAKTWNNLGSVQASLRQMPQAEASFREAIQLNPQYFQALINLANALAQPGGYDEAASLCRLALAIRPDDEPARYLLAALSGINPPATAPRSYVTPMFDGYANSFDEQLLGEFHYRGPTLLRDAVDDNPGSKALDILDIGCGTGLCGVAFLDLARSLTGVDLSANMLQRAQARGIYRELIQGELLNVLAASRERFDLVLSADVFIYVGDLTDIFPAVRAALRQGGRFAFVVETADGDGFVLRPSRRYAHSPAYLRRLAAASEFIELKASGGVLRVEHGNEIEGMAYVFQTNSALG